MPVSNSHNLVDCYPEFFLDWWKHICSLQQHFFLLLTFPTCHRNEIMALSTFSSGCSSPWCSTFYFLATYNLPLSQISTQPVLWPQGHHSAFVPSELDLREVGKGKKLNERKCPLQVTLPASPLDPLQWSHSWAYVWRKLIWKNTCTIVFIALFTIVMTWRQLKGPSTGEWIKEMWYIDTMEYYLTIKKNEIMALAATWLDLEIVTMSEVRKRQILDGIAYLWNLKIMMQMNLSTKQK